MDWNITVNHQKCTGCGQCVDNCPGEVYEVEHGRAVPANMEACHGCHTCEEVCPEDAVTVAEGVAAVARRNLS